jgi:uncharacterized integral membrane protein (TIGR00697 family)
MNPSIFLLQVAVIIGALYGAYRSGQQTLVALCCLMGVLANFFVLQQVELWGWNATSSDAFAVGIVFGLNLLQQKYGQKAAKKALGVSIMGMLFFAVVSQIHLLYLPSTNDIHHPHFKALLSPTPRLLLASLTTFFVVQWIDIWLYGVALRKWENISWRWKSAGCSLITQALDTALFTTLGLYGLLSEIGSIMLVSYTIKCVAVACLFIGSYLFKPLQVSDEI